MPTLSCHKVRQPAFVTTLVRLTLAAAMMAALLICFSLGTRSASVSSPRATCPSDLISNGGLELPVEYPGSDPLNWSTSQWQPYSQISRDSDNAHSGAVSLRIKSSTGNDASLWQEVTVEPNTPYMLTGWIKTANVSSGVGANLA